MIYIDTRQQAGKHRNIDDWLAVHGVATEYKKLDYGDYMTDGSNLSIDTKQSVQEVAANVGRDHARFVREIERANEAGCRLIVLVEERPEYADREELGKWVSGVCRRCRRCHPLYCKCKTKRNKPLNGPVLKKIIEKLEQDHGVRFEFCRRRDTARIICDLLGVEYKQ